MRFPLNLFDIQHAAEAACSRRALDSLLSSSASSSSTLGVAAGVWRLWRLWRHWCLKGRQTASQRLAGTTFQIRAVRFFFELGRNADGSFRTSKHKEYPPRFCAGLAQSFTDQFDFCLRTGHTSCATHTEECVELTRWLREAKQACLEIRESAGWLPDYQPG